MANSGKGYTSGCFICGKPGHDFRSCPDKVKGSGGKGSGKIYMVEPVDDTDEYGRFTVFKNYDSVPAAVPTLMAEVAAPDAEGYAVLDTGATESVGSLQSLERIHLRRTELLGDVSSIEVIRGPQKMFRFGNGSMQQSESYIHLKQNVGTHEISIGIYTLDAQGVPLLIGVRTLDRLGGILDTEQSVMVLKAVDPTLVIPLRRSRSGHLLVNLCSNWLSGGAKILFHEAISSPTTSEEKVFVAESFEKFDALHSPSCPSLSTTCFSTTRTSISPSPLTSAVSSSFCTLSSFACSDVFVIDEVHEESLPVIEAVHATLQSHTSMSNDTESEHLSSALTAPTFSSQDERTGMSLSLKILAVLSCSTFLFSDHGHIVGSERRRWEEGDKGQDQGRSQLRGEVRHQSHDWCGSQRSSHGGIPVPRQPQGSNQLSWQCHGKQRPCSLDRVRGLQTSAHLHPGLRGPCLEPSTRTDPSGRQAAGQDPGQRSCSQPSSSRPSHRVGRGRSVRFAPAGEDPCEKGDTAQECQRGQPSGVRPGEDHTTQERGLQDSRGDEPHSRPQGAQVRPDARGPGVRRPSQVFMEHYLIGFSGNSRGSFSQPVTPPVDEEHSILENDMTADEDYDQDQAEPMILEATEKECEKGGQASADLSDEKEPLYDIHESDTEFLDCGTDLLNVDEVDFLKNVVNDIQEEIDHCLTSCTPSTSDKKADFVELCCEEHSLMSTAWERTGGTAARIGLFNNFNLLTENGTQRALQVIESHRPKVMWISFPCGAFSSIQNLNELTPEGVARGKMRRKKARKLIRNGIRVIERHLYLGGEIFQEWPRHNSGWQLPEIHELWTALLDLGRFEEIHLDGCMFGLSTKDGLIKKPWRIRCSRPGWLTPLARKCDGTHSHIPALGGTIARQTALYTPKLCRAVCSNLQRGLHEAAAFGITEVRFNKEDLKTLTEQELNRLIATALKLHRLCGHPNNRALVRNLAARGADKHLLAVANELKCPECHEGQMAVPAVKASLEKEEQLWRTLQMDTFHFKYEGFTYHFLLMLDEASGFSVVHLVMYHLSDEHANITSAQVIDTLQRCWGQYFGLPERIRCDLEGSFRGEMVEDFAILVALN